MVKSISVWTLLGTSLIAQAQAPAGLDGVTFAKEPATLYAPVRETASALSMRLSLAQDGTILLEGKPLKGKGIVTPEGQRLIPVRELTDWGVSVSWDQASRTARVAWKGASAAIRLGSKRVVVDKSAQEMILYQGGREVMRSKVSTGAMANSTPNGDFRALMKKRMHYSSLYDNSPMPFSVQVVGNIFIHGYHTVPNRPASHGCIRVPLNGQAEFFYDWVEIGTPVIIQGDWQG